MEPGSETPVEGAPVEPLAPETAPPAPSEVPTGEHHQAAPAAPVPVQALAAGTSDSADLSSAMGIAQIMQDNPWMPLVVVILAVVAVLGGRQGWKFWSEKSARSHELELKKLELQAQANGVNGQQPPPCAAKDLEHESKLSKIAEQLNELDKRVGGIEKRLSMFAGMDPEQLEELEKRLKKVEKSIVALKKED